VRYVRSFKDPRAGIIPRPAVTTTIKDCGTPTTSSRSSARERTRAYPERRRRVKTCGQYFNFRPLSRRWLGSVAKDTCKLTPPSRPLWTLMNINSVPPASSTPWYHRVPLPLQEPPHYASESGSDRNKLDLSFHTFPFYSRDSSRAIAGLQPQFLPLSSFVENTVFLRASRRALL